MAIKFEQQVKKQRNLIILFIVLILIAGFVLWSGFKVDQEPVEILISKRLKSIEINFNIFNNPLLEQFQLIDKTPSFEGEFGRENPFIPF
ncbi:MAG: hypothetical protein KJI70_02150 [Patescibacteria group bacterium]|nr:hypothetical protein [Patescibacteria group bacterium]